MLEITNAVKVFAPSTPNEMKALNGLNLKLEDRICNHHRLKRSR